jgi:hypothetical protein
LIQETENRYPVYGLSGHPWRYFETGKEKQKNWSIEIKQDEIGIVGGYTVNGVEGYYEAFGIGHYQFDVVDGFLLVIKKEWKKKNRMLGLKKRRIMDGH